MTDESTVTTSDDPPGAVPASLVLVLSSANAAVRTVSLPSRGLVSIGRSSDCTVAIDDASLSRRHATLKVPELVIIDHASRNGTWIGDSRVAAETETPVTLGKPIRLGHVSALIVRVGAVDRGVLRQLDTQLARARSADAQLILVRTATPPRLPAWATAEGVRVLAHTDELWLAALPCGTVDVAEAVRRIERESREVGVAVFPSAGTSAAELYLAVERDRRRRLGREPSAMDDVYALVERIAPSHATVLIQGETGVGKEVLAELIHSRSPRTGAPLVKINCAAVTPSLFESQMFGHEKGAFTGAVDTQLGVIEAADRGTLFLDEVAELPLDLQAKLLRVIEDRVVVRVGAVKGREVDVRFVAASNESLQKRVDSGEFRADLYFRLAAVTLHVPPLRERVAEIQSLAELFVLRVAESMRAEPPAISGEALARLQTYRWPGNIRQLRNVVERAVMLCNGATILPEHLSFDEPRAEPPPPLDPNVKLDPNKLDDVMNALAACGGNQTRAARMLGISRNTLLARLDEFGVPRPRKKS